jgi:hypothetical protein
MNDLDRCERLLREIEPSLSESPVYLVDSTELPDTQRDNVRGKTGLWLDLQLANHLTEMGRWQGCGFAAVVCVDRIPATFRDVAGVVLHEAAHFLTFPAKRTEDYSSELAEWSTLLAKAVPLINADTDARRDSEPPWFQHEQDFIRAACHLAHRAGLILESIRPSHLCYDRYYGVTEQTWMASLERELKSMERISIREVLTVDPPSDFRELHSYLTKGWWHDADS